MKAPVLGLSIAVAAFAGSTLYLRQQLQVERQRSAQVEETSRQLNARIADLEKSREQYIHPRGAGHGSVISGALSADPPPPKAAASPTEAESSPAEWVAELSRQRTPAMDKMMRWQIRADHKRVYSGVGAALGISKEKTGQLIDLLTEQQLAQFNASADLPWSTDPREARRRAQESERQNEAAIQDLLGHDKALALQEYQQSLPAREEFRMLVNQLEGNDVTLTPEQNGKLLAVYLEERKRTPMPQFDELSEPAAYQAAYSAWQQEYSNRISEEARHILDSSQLSAFNEVQEWQKDLRSQFSAITFSTSGTAGDTVALRSNGTSFNAGSVAVAAPAAAATPVDNKNQRSD